MHTEIKLMDEKVDCLGGTGVFLGLVPLEWVCGRVLPGHKECRRRIGLPRGVAGLAY